MKYKVALFPLLFENKSIGFVFETNSFEDLVQKTCEHPWTSSIFKSEIPTFPDESKIDYFKQLIEKLQKHFNQNHYVWRKKDFLIEKTMIELDYDDGFSLDSAYSFFNQYKHIIGTTSSHQKDKDGVICDRFRVILFLNKPIHDHETFKQLFNGLIEKTKIPRPDPQSGNSAMKWKHFSEIISSSEEGELLDVDELLSLAPKINKVVLDKPIVYKTLPYKKRLHNNTKEFLSLGTGMSGKPFRFLFFSACLDLAHAGYSKQEAKEILSKVPYNKLGKKYEFEETYIPIINSVYSGEVPNYFIKENKKEKIMSKFKRGENDN